MPKARALAGRRLAWVLVGVLVLTAVVTPSVVSDAATKSPRYRYTKAEKCFMRKINRARAANGQRRLNWDKHLGYVARRHAKTMANHGGIWHDQNLGRRVTRWKVLGQNTGSGGRCKGLFKSFMGSAPHRANILGRWRYIGVGTKWEGGTLFVQQVFESRRDPGNVWSWP
ncbi:MAG TPA: CAP domain-containing protein [Actinomycetota bacterium]|nr:CAP domain-containing protein [Actinomycetota bacterium]